jgi:hypothetical protein
MSRCTADANKFSARWRESYWTGITGCFNTLACGQSDDMCMTNLTYGDPAYPETPEVKACLVHQAECKSFAEDYCMTIAVLTDEARAEAHACRDKPCGETKECLRTAGAFTF